MAKPLDALDYLSHPAKHDAAPFTVVFGSEPFLKRRTLSELRSAVLGTEGEFSLATFNGNDVQLRDVYDQLSTVSLFGDGRRMVVIEGADDFVSAHRAQLESYLAKPTSKAVLVLEVVTWPATTRLYKSVAELGLQIECKFPPPARLRKWLSTWTTDRYSCQLDQAAAELLVEMVEPELGLFDQELAKLASLAGDNRIITAELVQEAVGGWRTKTTWEMLDAAANGNARDALIQLDHLILAGEAPVGILAQISATLRRFAAATQLIEQGEANGRRVSLRQALEEAGIKGFVLGKSEGQLRQIGRQRGGQLYRWLLDADLAIKGASSSPARARFVLEQLIARLSAGAAPKRPAPRTLRAGK